MIRVWSRRFLLAVGYGLVAVGLLFVVLDLAIPAGRHNIGADVSVVSVGVIFALCARLIRV